MRFRSAALRQEEAARLVVGMLPALDATHCMLSVEAPPQPHPLPLTPLSAAQAARNAIMASVGQLLSRKASECLDATPAEQQPAPSVTPCDPLPRA